MTPNDTPATVPSGPLEVLRRASAGRPITRAGVSLVPVYLHQPLPGPVATGPDSPVDIAEAPVESVPTLTVTSSAADPVLLVEGETVAGGLQQRTLNVSVLVPAGATLAIPVSCVEAGRWGGGDRFRRGGSYAPRAVRRSKQTSVEASMRTARDRRTDQRLVWDSVEEQLERAAVPSSTRNLADADVALDRPGRLADALAELVGLGPLPGQCGVVVFHGRELVGVEVFGAPDLLSSHWAPLIRGVLLDAPGRPEGRPSVGRAVRFLDRLASTRAVEAPGVGLGTERHVRDRRLVGQVLRWDAAVLHASAFALAA